jgi:hypothetical protein
MWDRQISFYILSLGICISIFVHLEIKYIVMFISSCPFREHICVHLVPIFCIGLPYINLRMLGVLLQWFFTMCCISLLSDAMSRQSCLRWIGYLDLVE